MIEASGRDGGNMLWGMLSERRQQIQAEYYIIPNYGLYGWYNGNVKEERPIVLVKLHETTKEIGSEINKDKTRSWYKPKQMSVCPNVTMNNWN